MIPLPRKMQNLFRDHIREVLIEEYSKLPGTTEQQAIKMADKELANKSVEQILKMHCKNPLLSPRIFLHNVPRSVLYGSAISVGIAALTQIVTEGKVDVKGLTTTALIGGAAAGVGQLGSNSMVILANTKAGQKVVNWFMHSSLHIGGRLGSILSALPGAAVTSALFSYGLYFLDLTDLRTANRSMIASMAGAAGSALFTGGTMYVAILFGTASTGTPIITLSGAAATKAALAWIGHGAISAGGLGIAGGAAILFAGGILITIPCVYLTHLYFNIKDEKAEIARIRVLLDAADTRI
ncbi:MAG: hypothetical protein ACOYD9_05835 [Pyramidobacter sp.]